MNTTVCIIPDADLLAQYDNDATYSNERSIVVSASQAPRLIGKLIYLASYRKQVRVWSQEKRLAMKMSTVYLTAKEYLIASGIPKELLDITTSMFGYLDGRPLIEPLQRSVRFICVAWHARAVRAFHLLVDEFRHGKNIISYGCGSGIIELLALIASGNHHAKLILVDNDSDNIAIVNELIARFSRGGYDVGAQVTATHADIRTHQLPPDINTVASIGLLHNYFSLIDARRLVDQWFAASATKVITDICYDPARNLDHLNAAIRINFVRRVLDWKFGPPDGLLFHSPQEFVVSLADREVQIYDHGQNATIVVTLAD